MSKYSVKKPFTVVVAVVAILVLGIVSFMGMTPDLLPNINLPYVLVITAYPGATPERVETEVSKPLEQTMATLENIENVSSVSSENSSMLILEFTEDANMESIMVDILQKITQIQEYWSDGVSTPFLLKLNPNMLPVMVAAVNLEGMDTAELSAFVDETLLNKLEGVSGVASVSAEGVIEESIHVAFDPAKIAALNRKVQAEIGRGFGEAEDELEATQSQMEGQLDQIEAGKKALQEQINQMSGGSIDLGGLTGDDAEMMQMLEMMVAQLELLATLYMEAELYEQGAAMLAQLQASEASLTAQLNDARGLLNLLEAWKVEIPALEATLQTSGAAMNDPALSEEERALAAAEYEQANTRLAAIDHELLTRGLTREQIPDWIVGQAAAIQQAEAGLAELETLLASQGLTRPNLAASQAELQAAADQRRREIAEKEALLQRISEGMDIGEAIGEMAKQMVVGTLMLTDASAQMLIGEATIAMALREIEAGMGQIDDAKKEALKAADLDNIITMDNLANILLAQNFSMPAGYVEEDGVSYLVRVGDSIASVAELENLLLMDLGLDGLSPIFLKEVADVSVHSNEGEIYARLDGQDGVLLTFTKQSTYGTATVSDNIRQRFEELAEEYPGLSYTSLMDQGDYIYIVIDSIMQSLLFGAVFAIIILFMFLKDVRPTFITLCSIPISLLFAITLMYFSGVTINIISLSGLAVSVGMLVDNSVVVIENIYRLRNLGASPIQAAVSGASQVSAAIASSTLTTVCVFLPIVFVQGLTRDLFTDMALTIAYALLASLVVALTLVPVMSSAMLKNTSEKRNKTVDRFIALYEKTVKVTLNHKVILLVATVVMLALSIVLTLVRGFIFMPSMNMPELTVTVDMPEGATLEEAIETADAVGERLGEIEEVQTVGGMISSSGMLGMLGGMGSGGGASAGDSISFYVLLDEGARRGGIEVANQINEEFTDFGAEVTAESSSMADISMLGGSGVNIDIYSENMDDLLKTAKEVAAKVAAVPGVAEVDDGIGETDPEIRFVVNKNKAMQKGLTTAQVFMEITQALAQEQTATSITVEGEDFNVLVLTGEEGTLTPDFIRNYSFTVEDREGNEETVRLKDIAEIKETETARSINRDSQRRYVTVNAQVADGYNVSLVTQDVVRALEGYDAPTGVEIEYSGENETIMDAFVEMGKMLLLGVLLVYLIMVAQFQSLKSPFIVMFTIPLAFTGGLFALVLTGMELSVIALVGFVMLCGIIVNNGIVLVDYINQLRAEGMEKRQAIVEAGMTRMRPILMTSITTILGLVVMALGTGTGSELMQPIAIVCIGGLTYATLLTLYVIPALYDIFNQKELRVVDDEEFVVLDD